MRVKYTSEGSITKKFSFKDVPVGGKAHAELFKRILGYTKQGYEVLYEEYHKSKSVTIRTTDLRYWEKRKVNIFCRGHIKPRTQGYQAPLD